MAPPWKLSLSKHAEEKLMELRILVEEVRRVLENARRRFYDVVSRSEVAVSEVLLYSAQISLLIVFRRKNDKLHVVTAYPVKEVEEEISRKVKDGRWIIVG